MPVYRLPKELEELARELNIPVPGVVQNPSAPTTGASPAPTNASQNTHAKRPKPPRQAFPLHDDGACLAYLLGEAGAPQAPPAQWKVRRVLTPMGELRRWAQDEINRWVQKGNQEQTPIMELSTALRRLARHRGCVRMAQADEVTEVLLGHIPRLMPNMAKSLETLRLQLFYHQMEEGFAYCPPVLLVGPPGTGKTLFAEMLARALRVPTFRVSCGSTHGSFVMVGLQRGWGTARVGGIARMLLQSGIGNPLVILDELDKAFAEDNDKAPLWRVFYELLEPGNMRNFKDQCMELNMRADSVLFIATANEPDWIHEPVLDRMMVVEVPPVGEEEMRGIVQLLHEAQNRRAKHGKTSLDEHALDMIAEVAGGSVRAAQKVLRMAAAIAIVREQHGRITDKIVAQACEMVGLVARPKKTLAIPVGFVRA